MSLVQVKRAANILGLDSLPSVLSVGHIATLQTYDDPIPETLTRTQANLRRWGCAGLWCDTMIAETDAGKLPHTAHHIAAADFAHWLAAQGEQPSRMLAAWFKAQGVHTAAAQPQAAPVAPSASDAPETEWHLMATAEQLCAAFEAFTGMKREWFDNLNDKPALKAARFQPGQGGRNKREPLFYVYPVLQWLLDNRRKTGKKMQVATGWRMLEQHFPRVYEAYELSAPDPD